VTTAFPTTGGRPLVSIGMPIYNEAKHLAEALESLLAQDYRSFELIICDNASEDTSPRVAATYLEQDPRISYHRSERNMGSIENFRKALSLARGDYFMWASGHDLWRPTFVSRCVELLEREAKTVLCYAQATWLHDEAVLPGCLDTRGLDPLARLNVVLWGLGYAYPVYGLIRTRVLREVTLRDVVGVDIVLLAELAIRGAFGQVPAPLFCLRELPDFGSWTSYVKKISNRPLASSSPYVLFARFVYQLLSSVWKGFPRYRARAIAIPLVLACTTTKYWWIFQGLLRAKRDSHRSTEAGVSRVRP
jgi:glycosyltransferase involved in cell wall biosynthesis